MTKPNSVITADTLRRHQACAEGIKAFCEEFPDGLPLALWTRDLQIHALLSPLRSYLGWAWYRRIIQRWSFAGADLSGADLSGADLSGATLSVADLFRANISWANLSGADLYWANIDDALNVNADTQEQ